MERMRTISAHGRLWVLVCSLCSTGVLALDVTSVTNDLNDRTRESPFNPYDQGHQNPYHGGKGVLIRDLIDTLQDDPLIYVVPATFWSNDIYSVSGMYPDVDMMAKGAKDVWEYASVGVVIGTAMPTMFYDYLNLQKDGWGYGVFYARDSNSADIRCRWLETWKSYDCPKGWIDGTTGIWSSVPDKRGAGGYPAGNPYTAPNGSVWGGGAGCHFGRTKHGIDQVNAYDKNGRNLVQNHDCECDYSFAAGDWGDWINQWIADTKDKPGDSPLSFWGDRAICWVKNIRMMINMQNWLWWKWKKGWSEYTAWPGIGDEREYVGWNEIPVDRANVGNPLNWDAFLIKLPANVCGKPNYGQDDIPQCLKNPAQVRLEDRIEQWKNKGYIKIGKSFDSTRPGSYVVFAQEYKVGQSGNWRRAFFCTNWKGPSKRYQVVSTPISPNDQYGACYLESGAVTTTIV